MSQVIGLALAQLPSLYGDCMCEALKLRSLKPPLHSLGAESDEVPQLAVRQALLTKRGHMPHTASCVSGNVVDGQHLRDVPNSASSGHGAILVRDERGWRSIKSRTGAWNCCSESRQQNRPTNVEALIGLKKKFTVRAIPTSAFAFRDSDRYAVPVHVSLCRPPAGEHFQKGQALRWV